MLSLLPLLAFGVLLLAFAPGGKGTGPARRWHHSFLLAAVAWGVYLALGSELLSLIDGLTPLGIALLWLVLCVGLLLAMGTPRAQLARWWRLLRAPLSWSAAEKWALAFMLAGAGGLLLIAVVAPPNNADALLYHVARVAHWAQDGSLAHYPASWDAQLWSMPWAELVILHLSQLWGGIRPANLVQWFSLLGCAVVAAGIAEQLGADRRGKLLAAAFIGTAPLALLQATSSQNDLVVAFWAAASVYLGLRLLRRPARWFDWLPLGGAVGLGMLTKVTFYPFLGVILFGIFVASLRRAENRGRIVLGWALAALLAVALNTGIWSRNLRTFGTPLGSPQFVGDGLTMRLDPRAPLSGALQHLALNVTTPSEDIQRSFVSLINELNAWLGDPSRDFEVLPLWNHDDTAGNPIHMSLVAIAIGAAFLAPGNSLRGKRWYAVGLSLSFLAFAWAVVAGPYRVRYQLIFLALAAPLVAVMAQRMLSERARKGFLFGLLLLALPWLLFNRSRPLLSGGAHTRIGSILTEPSRKVLFVNFHKMEEPYSAAMAAIEQAQCRRVGLAINHLVPEYSLWWLADAPWSGVELRVVTPTAGDAVSSRDAFEPCAILCSVCKGRTEFDELPLQGQYERLRLYLR